MAASALAQEKVWVEKATYDKAECQYYEKLAKGIQQSTCAIFAGGSLANEVAKARQHIKQSLQCMDGVAAIANGSSQELLSRLVTVEKENQNLKNTVQELKTIIGKLESRVNALETPAPYLAICPAKPEAAPKSEAKPEADGDDDVDLFGSDDEEDDAEAARIREERLAAYAAKKAKKPAVIAKSNVILNVKAFDDETDLKKLEAEVRKIECPGLLWGASKLVPLVYGIYMLTISCVVEDDVSVDWLCETIQEIDDVQSCDIAAFNKI